MLLKRKFIYGLIVLSIILIVVNILLEVTKKKEIKTTPKISISEVELNFANTLNSYGIISEWIKKVYVRNKLSDSLNHLFNVTLPQDVSITTLIKDINSSFSSTNITVETIERRNHSNSQIKIYYDDELKLQANLRHSKRIIREYAEFSFLVHLILSDDENNWDKLKNIYHNYTYLITPSKIDLKKKNKLNREYALLINDQLSGTDYALEEEYSKQKLTNRIRAIIIAFGKDKPYLIDESSAVFNSKIYSFIRDEFRKRGIEFMSYQKYPKLTGSGKEELVSLFQFYAASLRGKEGKIFVINMNDFLELQSYIAKQIKMGDRVVDVKF